MPTKTIVDAHEYRICHYEQPGAWELHAQRLVAEWATFPLLLRGWRHYLRCCAGQDTRRLARALEGVIECRCDQCRLGAVALVVNARAREAARVAVERELG